MQQTANLYQFLAAGFDPKSSAPDRSSSVAKRRWPFDHVARRRASLPPVSLALALGRRVSRKSACKDRSSLGSIGRFVSARQLDLVYDRDTQGWLNGELGSDK